MKYLKSFFSGLSSGFFTGLGCILGVLAALVLANDSLSFSVDLQIGEVTVISAQIERSEAAE
jgi:hypothetical protein